MSAEVCPDCKTPNCGAYVNQPMGTPSELAICRLRTQLASAVVEGKKQ